MTFSIQIIDSKVSSELLYEITMGEDRESCPLSTTLWTPADYEFQWAEALEALSAGTVDCCILITDIQPSDVSNLIFYWALFRDGDTVRLQERFTPTQMAFLVGPPSMVAPHIPPRNQGTPEENAQVSEWEISIEDVRQFLKSFGGKSQLVKNEG